MPPRKTGLKRPYPIMFDTSLEEDEYISRASYDAGISKSELIRGAIFDMPPEIWRVKLVYLRRKQAMDNSIWKKRAERKRR